MSDTYDMIILGAGPGGYVCAIRAAQLGMRVAIVEQRAQEESSGPRLGGTCLNVGCIPSKALLDSSEHFAMARDHFSEHGIQVGKPKIDIKTMMKRKEKVVDTLVGGISGLMKKNNITVIAGRGQLVSTGTVAVHSGKDAQDRKEYHARHIVLAMGSTPIELHNLPVDGTHIITSDHAIALSSVPKRLVVVGGGVIGLELGSVWARLGAEVQVVEFLPQICPFLDADVAKALQRSLGKQGLTFHCSTKVQEASVSGKGKNAHVLLRATNSKDESVEFEADKVLVCVGRKPVTESAGLSDAGVTISERGRVMVNHDFATNVEGVYAIGDLIDGPMLAHKAEEEGVALAELLAGHANTMDHNLIPNVIYTEPEVASVGLTEAQAKERGIAVKVGKFSYAANGRARAASATDGFVKILADSTSDQVLGAAIIGTRASDLLAEIVSVMAFGGSSEDIARTCHSHPTFSESVKEAALDCLGRVLHS
ncbi:MAG: dihydrolipoyl dehydrogenase [Planctomycetota bacterium]|nr:MAG: dihydrolipoyl dehydrogenase [Planctomycetota bacterium]